MSSFILLAVGRFTLTVNKNILKDIHWCNRLPSHLSHPLLLNNDFNPHWMSYTRSLMPDLNYAYFKGRRVAHCNGYLDWQIITSELMSQ